MKKRMWYLILPLITIVLEILPYGAVCNFANPEGEAWHRTYSYFDLTPFGYANFSPFLTALMTVAIAILIIIYCLNGKYNVAKITKVMLLISVILSLCPLLFGIRYFSVIGALITLSLMSELILLCVNIRK